MKNKQFFKTNYDVKTIKKTTRKIVDKWSVPLQPNEACVTPKQGSEIPAPKQSLLLLKKLI